MELFNQEAEQAILGTIIINNTYLDKIADLLLPKHFYFPENYAIFNRIVEVAMDMEANQITLTNFCGQNEFVKLVGGKAYLSELLAYASPVISIRSLALLLIQLHAKREALALIEKYTSSIGEGDFNKETSILIDELAGLLIVDSLKQSQNTKELVDELEQEEKEDKGNRFVPTGFSEIDKFMDGGMYSKTMTILAARPSVGKTSIAQQIILNAARKDKKCFFLSLEVDRKSGVLKFLSNLASVELWKYKIKKLNHFEDEAWRRAKDEFKKLDIVINDSHGQNISQIQRIIKTQFAKSRFDLLVVDYTQIIKAVDTKNKNEAQILKEITTALKSIARTYDISLLALAQINRKGAEGADQEPTMNDIKGSGGFEEDADYLMIIHRSRQEDKKEGYFSNSGKLILAKNRHGRTGEIAIKFQGEFSRFTQVDGF